jgi:putative hemolysin
MLQRVSDLFHRYYSSRLNRIHEFAPKIQINFKIGSFRIKTATDIEELKECLRLRHDVLFKEFLGSETPHKWDIDHYDLFYDHLIIKDERSGLIVATARLNAFPENSRFLSEETFDLSRILSHRSSQLEVGRACIKKEYRRGLVLSLLWKGIGEYAAKAKSQTVLGILNFQVRTPREAALLQRYFFETNRYTPEFLAPTHLAYKMTEIDAWELHFKRNLTIEEKAEAESLIPDFCQSYLKMGAYVGGEPAWNSDFSCVQFITILQREDLSRSLWLRAV